MMKYLTEKNALRLIAVLGAITVLVLLNMNPIPQDLAYHHFADTKAVLAIPNMLNVVSNLPFLYIGGLGLYHLLFTKSLHIIEANKPAYIAFFLGAALVGIGSSYYHLSPNNQTLLWDRLPMTIAFMGLCSVIISEFMSVEIGKSLLIPFLVLGISSVFYWDYTESHGAGDLRFYAIIQFFPLFAIPIILLSFKAKYQQVSAYWWLLATYLIAKVFELLDTQTYALLNIISGHSLKHICAAVGAYILLRSYQARKTVETS
ncbi:MAG: alkaline phytoceramidase [Methyloprofundus sp.]|nr:alkaline phytoceramidase [Methyloprofundus sp.]